MLDWSLWLACILQSINSITVTFSETTWDKSILFFELGNLQLEINQFFYLVYEMIKSILLSGLWDGKSFTHVIKSFSIFIPFFVLKVPLTPLLYYITSFVLLFSLISHYKSLISPQFKNFHSSTILNLYVHELTQKYVSRRYTKTHLNLEYKLKDTWEKVIGYSNFKKEGITFFDKIIRPK